MDNEDKERFSSYVYNKRYSSISEFSIVDNKFNEKYTALVLSKKEKYNPIGDKKYDKIFDTREYYWLNGNKPDITDDFIEELYKSAKWKRSIYSIY